MTTKQIAEMEEMLATLVLKIKGVETRVDDWGKTMDESRLFGRLDQVEEDLSVRGSTDNDHLGKIDAINARITESERAMTTWVETQTRVTRDLIENEERARQALGELVQQIENRLGPVEQSCRSNAETDLPHTELHTQEGITITNMAAILERHEKEIVGVGDVQAHTEHSEDRRHVKALPTAKGYRIEASVELYGSDTHIVAQELAKLVEECRRELKEPLEEVTGVV